MSNKVELKGKCLCGAVKYKLSEKPLFTEWASESFKEMVKKSYN
jgi:hypothetical protein